MRVMMIWYVDWKRICLYISTENNGAVFLSGVRSRSASEAGSVASARAANVSMIILIQRSCTADKTEDSEADATAVTNVITTAVTLVETWNCKNLRTASLTQRPHMIALTIDEKLSSMRMMSDASFATSVPAIPIEKPTSAVF